MNCFGAKGKKNVPKQQSLLSPSRVQTKRNRTGTFLSRRTNYTNTVVDLISSSLAKSPGNDETTATMMPFTQPIPAVRRNSKVETLPSINSRIAPPVKPRTNVKVLPESNEIKKKRLGTTLSSNELSPLTLPKIKNISPISYEYPIEPLPNSNRSSTRHTPGLCGLMNIGNTCFMNSALQCLSNVPELTRWAKEQQSTSIRNKNIVQIYSSLMQTMWSGEYACINPRDIKESISRSASIFTGYGQHDSHEFMNSLLNALDTIDSTVTNLFRIHLQSQVKCTQCSFLDVTDETTTFLALPLPTEINFSKKIFLKNLIEYFCEENDLDGSYYCHSCEDYTRARQKTIICSPLPRVLIIQLKRFPFDGTQNKLDTFVRYQLQHTNLLSDNDRYDLCAVSVHGGTLAGGHYTTLAKNNETTRWYRFNDSHVDEINSDDLLRTVITCDAYVLVYLKNEMREENSKKSS